MGFRTVVIFNNDLIHTLKNDPNLGEKIAHASSMFYVGETPHDLNRARFPFDVVEVCHADQATLARIDSLSMKPLARGSYLNDDIKLIREAADKLGYRLVKKSTK